MSMPTSTCLRTTSRMPAVIAASSASRSYGRLSVRAFMPSMISRGRIKLPVWVVRKRSELRCIRGVGHCARCRQDCQAIMMRNTLVRVKAVQLVAPQTLRFVDVPEPVLAEGQVLVRMDYLAVCGSDLKFYDRALPADMYPLTP